MRQVLFFGSGLFPSHVSLPFKRFSYSLVHWPSHVFLGCFDAWLLHYLLSLSHEKSLFFTLALQPFLKRKNSVLVPTTLPWADVTSWDQIVVVAELWHGLCVEKFFVGESQLFSPDKKLSGERKNPRRITFYRTSAERGGRSYLMASADKKLSITFYRAHDKERPN